MSDFAFTSQDPAGDTGYPQFVQPSVYTRGDALEDLDNDSEMWNMYLNEVNDEDKRITDAWKEDANSIVTFTGLFSAIVGAFIIEFYKNLSSDSGGQTVALLQQISLQLPNSPNSANSNTANQPSSPGTAMVWVNALWLISLVLSLTCALIATLLQQWARRYIETPKSSNVQRHRARVRSLLLVGTKLYKIPLIVGMLPTLLHLSVYLFLTGLVITFHTIHKKVAIAVDVAVGVSALAYLALSILPCVDVRCPYRTPISQLLWYPCHAFLSFAAPFLDRCILGLRELLNQPARSSGLSVSHHWQYFTYGLEKSIVHRAVETLKGGDRGRVTRLFNQLALVDRKKFLRFAASIPRHKILDLILPVDSLLLRGSLLALLRSSAAGIGEADVNRRSLIVCLHAIRHIFKAPIPDSDLDFMRTHFANMDLMEYLWEDNNTAIRVTSRSICALLAKQVVRNPLRGPQLRWLREVFGRDAPETTDVATWDRMNLRSFINEVLADQEGDLPTEDATSFKETLAILLDVRTDDDFDANFQSRLSEEVQRMRRSAIDDDVVDKLRSMFPFLRLSHPASPTAITRGYTPVTADSASTHGSTPVSTDSASTRAASSPAASASAPTPAPATSSPAASSHATSSHVVLTRGGSTPVTADSASTRAASSLASAHTPSPAASSLASARTPSPTASSLASTRAPSPAASSLASAHTPSPTASSLASARAPSSLASAHAPSPAASSLASARTPSPVASSLASARAPSSLASARTPSPVASSLASARAPSPVASSLASARTPSPTASSLASARAPSPAASSLASAHTPSPTASSLASARAPSNLASAHAPSPAASSLASAHAPSPAASASAASLHRDPLEQV
ncbi:hypothetical protein V8E52_004715 [Russula decolorans]